MESYATNMVVREILYRKDDDTSGIFAAHVLLEDRSLEFHRGGSLDAGLEHWPGGPAVPLVITK